MYSYNFILTLTFPPLRTRILSQLRVFSMLCVMKRTVEDLNLLEKKQDRLKTCFKDCAMCFSVLLVLCPAIRLVNLIESHS